MKVSSSVALEPGISPSDLTSGVVKGDTAFAWRSDLEGELGVGRKLYFDDLRLGQHTITLTVTDSDGFIGTDSISILIGSHTYLPMLLKAD